MPLTFKGYRAEYECPRPELERLELNGPSGEQMIYVRDGRFLAVYGDQSFAVYAFSVAYDLDYMARCDPEYFLDRCETNSSRRAHQLGLRHAVALMQAGVEPEGVEHG